MAVCTLTPAEPLRIALELARREAEALGRREAETGVEVLFGAMTSSLTSSKWFEADI